jgi:hypothetical protein
MKNIMLIGICLLAVNCKGVSQEKEMKDNTAI